MTSPACALVGATEAHGGHFLHETPGAACVERSGAGLSGREWAIVAIMLAQAASCAVGGFALRGWVEAPLSDRPCTTQGWAR